MNEKEREQVALFRYGLIAPLFNGQVDSKEYLKGLEGKVHSIPYYGEKKIAQKTMKEWLLNYRRNGFEALKPKKRIDRGNSRRLSPDDQDQILEIRKKTPHMPVSVFYEQLIERGEIQKTQISYSTIIRLLKKHNLIGKQMLAIPERKRFAHDKVNVLWQADLSHGPYVPINGKKTKTFLIAYIDDCSRLVPYAQFFSSEKFDGLRVVTKEALIRRGKPTILYADNGKIYRSETLQYACAQLGITLAHTQPYDPRAKGKVERLFKTIQTRFYPLLQTDPVHSLEELNERFWNWLERDYHRRAHASLDNKTPLEVFESQLKDITFLEDLSILETIFLKREQRKVKPDGTISIDKKLYEVPSCFIGQSIDVRFDENGIYVFEENKEVAKAIPVSMKDNAHVKRIRSPFALTQSADVKGEQDHV
ncbi:DDE-type integrase/transposase/recombinase [Anaerobacillus isosaccharinicus]|uniref:DDE-type integrase/transposase/recombinase n=1 Tax=Anaerobacillus isosaccharinicus TaxID=1532552 RepID=A0A1S2L5J8_9BACI|nr:DDE-type integrase/transposase/recombinase [Anaerobacillus isosaccharinicus]MBA5583971.1 DDE-type integrase/transposase/recombinase [Anaerobacillus isosaccharinicus]MBA5585241.1 DDE-type integrase/transposase/recombinase [Anaerobacillus isosaccharinicus]MBA5586302.1 DDE-type integrase/transposase/recombinase [Anaerobacillus isosaccharinicus]MBA5586339.1 DDE-type integrase/transposase/recombinase [Anaerobacillus isosaccharinicus]QOY35412.1 DDE-type integrase/transposase/recombinase [Anaeroba